MDKCPDLVIWDKNANDVEIGENIIQIAIEYKNCQDRQGELVDRIQVMMKH